MDKLKKVFSPGSSKDDEVLYGDAETRRRESTGKVHDSQPPQLHSTEGTEKKEGGGVMRQILNPGGEKYDEYHGTTASTAAPTQDPRKLSTTEEGQKDSTITQQILNPNREKYDEQRFGSTATTTDAPAGHAAPQTVSPDAQLQTDKGQKDHSILRQILNPHGDKYDSEGFGSTAHVVGQGSNTTGSSTGAGVGSSATQGIPDRTAQTGTGTDSHLGRDAGIAGGLGAAGAGTYAATHGGPTTTTTTTTTTSSQPITERAHPLSGQSAGADHINPVGAAGAGAGAYGATRAGDHVTPTTGQANTAVLDRPHPLGGHDAAGDHINPISAPEDPAAASSTAGTHSNLGRDAGIAGVGAAGLGAGYAAHEHNQNRSNPLTGTTGSGTTGVGGSNVSSQLNSAPRDVQDATYTARQYNVGGSAAPAEGYVHHTHGPHSTDIANRLDPHVPGEFPTESGEDRHRVAGTTSAVPATSIPARDSSLTAAQPGQTSDQHHGRDAALAGGLVGAGGAYAATRDHPSSTTGVAGQQAVGSNTTSASNVVGAGAGSSGLTDRGTSNLPGTTGSTTGTTQTQPGQEHHYGRDAALGAGAGAAGYGAYEAVQGRGDTGPANKTIGPHDSNIANIVDPRVQPQPEKMKDSKTTGPHSSDLANKADPRVKETSTARAGAVASDRKQTVGEKLYPDSTPTNRPTTEHTGAEQHPYPGLQGTEDQHRGRDAALAGGAGAVGGAGAYAATRGHDGPVTEQLASAQGTQTQPAYHATTDASAATQPGTNLPDSRHRNKEAAHAGEAGLAGAGVGAGAGALASSHGAQTQPAYQATTDSSAATQPGTNLPDSRHRNKEAAHAGEAGLAGTAVGAGAGAYGTGDQSAAKKTDPSAGAVDTPVQHTGDPKAIAATHRDDKGHSSSSHSKEEEKEKKPSLIHRILHPGEGKEKEKDSHHEEKKHDHGSSSHSHADDGHNKLHKKALGEGKTTEEAAHHAGGNDGRVIEPHTGLPMNVEKYGTGQGGTDGARNIEGYHETDPAIRNASVGTGVGAGTSAGHAQPGQEGVAGPDWDAIKKANTPY